MRQRSSSLNPSATQQAWTCTGDMRSDKRKETESTDLYQIFRGKTTICERITGVAYEIADTDQSATKQRAASPRTMGEKLTEESVRLLRVIGRSAALTG